MRVMKDAVGRFQSNFRILFPCCTYSVPLFFQKREQNFKKLPGNAQLASAEAQKPEFWRLKRGTNSEKTSENAQDSLPPETALTFRNELPAAAHDLIKQKGADA